MVHRLLCAARTPWTWAVAGVVALALGLRLWVGPRTVDDAFITFRYARNLASGAGFVYNPGERVLGTTTPLFTVLLAAARRVSLDLGLAAMVVNAMADAGTVVILFLIAKRLCRRPLPAWVCALLFAFSAGSIRFAGGGMETGLFTFLLVLSLWLFFAGRYTISGVAVGLATLVRPEGLVLLATVAGVYVAARRRVPWALLASATVVLLPWVVFAFAYFGSPVPHSLIAKNTYRFPPLTAVKTLLGYLVQYTLPVQEAPVQGIPKYAVLGGYGLLGGLAACRTGRWFSTNLALFVFPLAYLAAYAVGNPPVWKWYAVPLVPFVLCIVCWGVCEALHLAGGRHAWLRADVLWAIIALGTLPAGVAQAVRIERNDFRQGRELAYARIAGKIQGAWDEAWIAAPEIGALGYLLPRSRILDTQGLVSPEALPYRVAEMEMLEKGDVETVWRVGSSVPARLIQAERPDLIVGLEVFLRTLREDAWFADNYRMVLREPSAVFGSDGVWVFARVEAD